jgi:hypothetical protein
MVTHMIEVGRRSDKYTEIFVIGGAKITVHAAVDDVARSTRQPMIASKTAAVGSRLWHSR